MKNEEAFNRYLMDRASAKSEVIVQRTGKKLTEKKVGSLLERMFRYHELIERIHKKGYPRSLLRFLLENRIQGKSTFEDKAKIGDLQKELRKRGFKVFN